MIYLFNVSKDDNFCSVILNILDVTHVEIIELIEFDNVNVWFQSVKNLFQKYNINYHYYLGSDEYYTILKLAIPKEKTAIIRKVWEDLNTVKLIKKIQDNLLDFPIDLEHLKDDIFMDDIKTDTLKLIASLSGFYVDFKPYSDGVFMHYSPVHERDNINYSIFGDASLERVLKCFE
jgi:hypothetical protein